MANRLILVSYTVSAAALVLATSLAIAEVVTLEPNTDEPRMEIPLDPIVIESDGLAPEPTLEQLFQNFRQVLAQPPSLLSGERQLSDGGLEVRTRLGRLCAKPVPGAATRSGPGGDIALAVPCAAF